MTDNYYSPPAAEELRADQNDFLDDPHPSQKLSLIGMVALKQPVCA